MLSWRCELCGNDDSGERSRVVASSSSSTIRVASRREAVKSELRVAGRQAGNDATFSTVASRIPSMQGVHLSPVKLFVEVGAASSSTLWVDCLA